MGDNLDNDNFREEKNFDKSEMKLVIPKIDFDMNIYNINSELNNVDYNIEILGSSDFENNLFYIVGHSGNGNNCYFNDLKELQIKDNVYIFINNKVIVYEIINKYFIVKNGYMEIDNNKSGYIYLITCDIFNNDKQLVLEGMMIN